MADKDSRTGTRYDNQQLADFVDSVHAGHDPALAAAFAAPAEEGMPTIMVSPSEARFLELLLRLAGAKSAVEIGTLAGYSAIRIARGLAPGGKLWSLELEPGHAEVARRNLAAADLTDRVEVVVGRALDLLAELQPHGPFDAVFIDADKESYDQYAEWALANLRPGGLLVADNAYFFGRLMEESDAAAAVRRFHRLVAAGCESTCVPTPDGMVVAIKR